MKGCMKMTEERIGLGENQKFILGHVKIVFPILHQIKIRQLVMSLTEDRYFGVTNAWWNDPGWLSREYKDRKRR